MKKILLATKGSNDATSFLRAWGAFTAPEMKKEGLEPVRPPEDQRWVCDWTYYFECDVVYLHRPSSALDFHILERAKLLGVPVWVDLDDDLENITSDNPVYSAYSSDDCRKIIAHCIREADVLSVGGELHATRIRREYGREVHLIPNALDDRLLGLKKPFNYSKKVSWRGSESHRTDLLYYDTEIKRVIDEHEDYDFAFFALNPYWLSFDRKRANVSWVSQMNLFEFYNALTARNAAFHFHPLIDTIFNRVKSNLGWSDATLAGSVYLAPDHEENRRPGIQTYAAGNKKDFEDAFYALLHADEAFLKIQHDLSWEWICDNILMSKVNQSRLSILRNL